VCAWYALQVSKLAGAPRFELYSTSANRDIAIESLRTFLREQGDRFRRPAD
jgi:hypothetical protein